MFFRLEMDIACTEFFGSSQYDFHGAGSVDIAAFLEGKKFLEIMVELLEVLAAQGNANKIEIIEEGVLFILFGRPIE